MRWGRMSDVPGPTAVGDVRNPCLRNCAVKVPYLRGDVNPFVSRSASIEDDSPAQAFGAGEDGAHDVPLLPGW